ncbi:MAG: phage antirepressor KilAC domain-containing protein [Oscillospiraceae bacterium]|nr:phage antirepressor KilAC domain-containing protein [Oscillospiraceae bacterium]
MLVKSFTDDLAWTVQRQLVNSYFRVRQMQAILDSYMIDDPVKRAERWIEEQKERQALAVKVEEQNKRIEEMRPKEIFADALTTSDKSILVGDLAKILKQNGVDTGQKRLFAWLRENGYLMKHGASYNLPTQRSMELGLFETKETPVIHADGHTTVSFTVKVTGKGQQYFVNKFLGIEAVRI